MSKRKKKNQVRDNRNVPMIGYVLGDTYNNLCCTEYTSLDQCPEIMTACRRIAELIGSMTIHLMQ